MEARDEVGVESKERGAVTLGCHGWIARHSQQDVRCVRAGLHSRWAGQGELSGTYNGLPYVECPAVTMGWPRCLGWLLLRESMKQHSRGFS